MPYSPENNPYIPGDPYSYDLKWIVQQIKELKSDLKNLEEISINPTIISDASQIITPGSNITIVNAYAVKWSKMAVLFITWNSSSAISVGADGNLTDVNVGTLAADKTPVMLSMLSGYQATGQLTLHYNATTAGQLTLKGGDATGSSRTIAAGANMIATGIIMLP